jgi:hypothetical protein
MLLWHMKETEYIQGRCPEGISTTASNEEEPMMTIPNPKSDQAERPGPPAAFAGALRLGEPQAHGSLTVVPLAFWSDRGPRYETLSAALRAGTFHVTEVNAGGSVPELRVINQGAVGVLILDGEELVGAKQNRVLNAAVFVREKSSLVVPVSCVEAGRWHCTSSEFADEEFVVHAKVRRAVHESVSLNLRAAGGHRSDQGAVWQEVAELQQFAECPSRTGAHRDVYAQRAGDIAGYLDAFPLQPGQHGLLVLRDGEVVGLDFVSRAACYAQLHAKLLRSYAFDAVTREMSRGRAAEVSGGKAAKAKKGEKGEGVGLRPDAALTRARAFLETVAGLPGRSFKSPGRGWDVRYAGDGVSGSTLTAGGVAVHGALFAADDEQGRGEIVHADVQAEQPMVGFERRRRNHGEQC